MIAVSNELNVPPVLQPFNNVAVREIPTEFQDLLNPAKPLTAIQFAPRVFSAPYWAIMALPSVPLIGGLIQIVLRPMPASEEAFGLIFAIPLLLVLSAMFFFANRKQKYKRLVESGRLRIGVFIHKDALLVRTGGNSCTLLPRDLLRGVIFARYKHNKHMSATKLIFVDSAGNEYPNVVGVNSFGVFDMFDHFQNLSDALHSWKPELEIVEKS
jgi:hypothetical protein